MSDATKRDLLIVTCAVSAGVHAALVPEHLAESAAAGAGFIAAAALLAGLVLALTFRPDERLVAAAGLTLAGLIFSYVLATTSGMPVLMRQPEPVDGLALATKAFEALGLLVAWSLLRTERHPFPPRQRRRQGASA